MVVGLGHWQLNEFAITPGNATSLPPLITVHGLRVNTHPDRVSFVDVYLQQLTMLQYLTMHLQSHVEYVPGSELEEPGVSLSQLTAQGYQEMADAKSAAEVAALRALGWKISGAANGAVVTAVVSASPADQAGLGVEDRIVTANGHPIRTACDLIGFVHRLPVGSAVHLGVVHQHFTALGNIKVGREHTYVMRSVAPPAGAGSLGCPGLRGADASFLGLALETGTQWSLPGRIAINTSLIGGPSAGLAMTLSLIATLSKDSITGGHAIATTGTISVNGDVGPVGGVAEKTIAVERAGIKYFFVPSSEAATAQAEATPGFHVIPVNTLGQVLTYLRAIGGHAPTPISAPTKP